MISYMHKVGLALETRFSDESFYADQCSFIEPLKRNFIRCDIKQVLQKVDSRGWLNIDKLQRQYKTYLFNGFLFTDTCKQDITKFFLYLFQKEQFSELARLVLLTVSPDSVACERGISVIVKNEHRTSLTDLTLNALLALALDNRSVAEFPYKCAL